MATAAVNEIEKQFAHLSLEDQLSVLERLALHFRVGHAVNSGFHGDPLGVSLAYLEMQRELDRLGSEFGAGDSDLLSESR